MNRTLRHSSVALAAFLACASARAQSTERASVSTGGTEANGISGLGAMSGDGRFVVFESSASNLVAGDTNGFKDIFVRDRLNGTTELVSSDSAGVIGDSESDDPFISPDGRWVVFYSYATNLVAGDTNGDFDVYIKDRQSGATERISLSTAGAEGDWNARYAAVSADGRYVAFSSNSTNMAPGDTNSAYDIFIRDRLNLTTEMVSVDNGGLQGTQQSIYPALSADGRYVAFESNAPNLVPGDTNNVRDIIVRDLVGLTTERVSVDSAGVQANGACFWPSISSDGRYVAFHSSATNLVAGDTNATLDVFVHDRQTGTTVRVSVDSAGVQGGGQSLNPTISLTGRYVTFESAASNLVAGDTNALRDIFVHDRQTGTTERVSIDTAGAQANSLSQWAAIAGDGSAVAFQSPATNLVSGDTNVLQDIFVRERGGGVSPGSDLCQAGTGSVMACPCGNPPANAPRGCNNSSNTGGAQVVSSGTPSLANDTLLFVTNGERPTATSILLQGTVEVTNGTTFGMGVRCVGGTLKRLYVKSASGGSITAPGPGDLSVSARSAQLNAPIAPGTSRWYAVYYRDPNVLGGCPAASTFNITQTQLVGWNP
jgi:Tol biopolymer transport system component